MSKRTTYPESRKAMERLISAAQLQRIRLTQSHVETNIGSPDEAASAVIVLDTRESARMASESILKANVSFTVEIYENGDEELPPETSPLVAVMVEFELEYELQGDLGVSEGELAAFAEGSALFNAWPFGREYVASTFRRMDLPPVTLPLLKRLPFPSLSERTTDKPPSQHRHG